MRNASFFIVTLLISLNVFSQNDIGQGSPFIQNYNSKDFNTSLDQVWATVQDKRGVMYFGYNGGVLEFDGNSWRDIETPARSVVRSFALDDSTGRIYVGTVGDFGYLGADSTSTLQYVSLLDKVPEEHRTFKDVWQTFIVNNQVIFNTASAIFILEGDSIKIIHPEKKFLMSFVVNNRFYVLDQGKGLATLKNNRLKLIAGSEQFANDRIYTMLPYENDKILMVSIAQGILIYSPNLNGTDRFTKPLNFQEVDKFISKNQVYCAEKLAKNQFVLGTLHDGIIIIDKNGRIIRHINKISGLQDLMVISLYVDAKKNIWAGLNKGLSYIITNSPFSLYDEKNGIPGTISTSKLYNNQLYIGSFQGLYRKEKQNTFTLIENTKSISWHLAEIQEKLLLAHYNGVFIINGNKARNITPKARNAGALVPYQNGKYVFAGAENGLHLLEFRKGNWRLKHKIRGFEGLANSFQIDDYNNLWVTDVYKGIYKLKLNGQLDSVVESNFYDTVQGLPANNYNFVFKIKTEKQTSGIVFGTEKGIYKYNGQTDRFEPDNYFNQLLPKEDGLNEFVQDKKGNIYFQKGGEKGILRLQNNGQFKLVRTPFLKFKDLFTIDISLLDSTKTMFCSADVAIQYNSQIKPDYDAPYSAIIRQVLVSDSLIFGGTQSNPEKTVLTYNQNNLQFSYSALFYEDHNKTQYSTSLEGYNNKWSDWSLKTEIQYTNLPEGKYIFKVKAKNIYEKESAIAEYEFEILAPWYCTYWAYSGYFIAAVLFVFVLIRLNSLRLIREKKKLEAIIIDRTSEIIKKNAKLKHEREFLQILMDTNPNPQYYKDENGKYIGCNQSFVNITGLPKNEILGKTYKEIPILNTNTDHENVDKKLLKTGEIKKYQTSIIFSDNINRDFEIIKTGYKNSDNKMGILGIMIDISHIKEQERIILAQEKEIHNKEREELEKNISEMTFQLIQNNQYINKFIHDLAVLSEYSNKDGNRIIRSLSLEYKNIIEDKNWERFEILFKKNYPEYFNKIQYNFPDLTQNDKKVCMMVFLNFSSKDIATATLKSIRTIESTRLRVRKKIKIIGENVELSTFLKSL